jgi:hypothetical protein
MPADLKMALEMARTLNEISNSARFKTRVFGGEDRVRWEYWPVACSRDDERWSESMDDRLSATTF